jgi:hypothetical protein
MSMCIANNNGGAVLGANGNFCAIQTWQAGQPQAAMAACSLLTNVTATIVNATATGTLTFQELGLDGTWRAMSTPAPISLSSATTNVILTGAYHGIRVALSALAVSTVTYVEIRATVSPTN